MFSAAAPAGPHRCPSAPIASRWTRPSGRKNAHRGLAACRRPASGKSCSQAPIASGKNPRSPTTARRSHLLPQSAPSNSGQAVTATAVAISTINTLPEVEVTATPTLATVIANVVFLPTALFYPTLTAADDMCPCGMYAKPSGRSPPADAKDPTGSKAPGKPGSAEGFEDPPGGEQWGQAPNGEWGWVDDNGNVWVPTGQGGGAHGGPHWDVQTGGGYINVYPGGTTRPGS